MLNTSSQKNNIKSVMFVSKREDRSNEIVHKLTYLLNSKNISITDKNPDLLIAVGGDGTFLRACRETGFSKNIIYTGVNTGTLGFLQDTTPNDIFSLIEYISYEKFLSIQNISIGNSKIYFRNGKVRSESFLNEILIGGKDYSRIDFSEYIQNHFLQNISCTALIVSTSTGQTAYSMSLNGPINLSKNDILTSNIIAPIRNSIKETNSFISNSIESDTFTIIISPKNRNSLTINLDYETLPTFGSNSIEKIVISISPNKLKKLNISNENKITTIRKKLI